jgi:hypothetical protein
VMVEKARMKAVVAAVEEDAILVPEVIRGNAG